eukprot:CAMPEP_0197524858 /NCGR_PEP_ID=MMETSP1318-20131121/10169_1 /TAXON_ID=552666 /ORGANISM="Partenskyella glossopodia, Strain RCC365" /LENGTH=108 /DNA_ID=CAMNT_0043077931 /DNA_START=28 /DNA_END=354 /DNA_ORIENTATION=-
MAAAHRVPGARLGEFVGQQVRIVGKISNFDGDNATVETDGGTAVKVVGINHGNQYSSQFVEVIARVQDANTVQELKAVSFGETFDLEMYNVAIKYASGKYSYLCRNEG